MPSPILDRLKMDTRDTRGITLDLLIQIRRVLLQIKIEVLQ